MPPNLKFMDQQPTNCFVAEQHFHAAEARELLEYPHMMTYALLDLQCLGTQMHTKEGLKALTDSLSQKEQDILNKFAMASRKREWLGGRLAAKCAAARLFELMESRQSAIPWQEYSILADENGRPNLAVASSNTSGPMPDISISHSGLFAAAMAVSHGYAGIDIQQVVQKVIRVKDRFCTPGEEQLLRDFFSLEPKNIAATLTKLWAAKEAMRKASSTWSLPGFLEMELAEITGDPPQDGFAPRGFIFKMASSAGFTHSSCRVVVVDIADYVLALTARSATLD